MSQSSIYFKCDPANQSKHRLDTTDFPCQVQCSSDFGKKKISGELFRKFGKCAEHCKKIKAIFTMDESKGKCDIASK